MSEALPQVGIQTTCFDSPSHFIISIILLSVLHGNRFLAPKLLGSSSGERGLEVLEDSQLNMKQQCALVAEMVNSIHGSANGSIGNRSGKVMIALYLAPV